MEKVKQKRALFITCDIPLIKPNMVDSFIEKSKELKQDIIMSYVDSKEPSFTKFKNLGIVQAGIARFKEAKLMLGNMAIVDTSLRKKINPKVMETYYDHRKINAGPYLLRIYNFLCMLYTIGFFPVIKLFLGKYKIKEAEDEVKKRFNISFRVVTLPYPEIALDIDWDKDYTLIKHYMETQKSL